MITMDKNELQFDAPFYAWNCLTLSIKNKKDVHLVIKNEKVMSDFLKLLISRVNTIDGVKDSAKALKQLQLSKV